MHCAKTVMEMLACKIDTQGFPTENQVLLLILHFSVPTNCVTLALCSLIPPIKRGKRQFNVTVVTMYMNSTDSCLH